MASNHEPMEWDRAVPHRDDLLDRDIMRRWFADRLATEVADAEVIRVKYAIGRNLRVVYRLQTPQASKVLTARTFPAGPTGLAAPASAPAASSLNAPELGARFWVFPDDRRLQGLDRILVPAALRPIVQGWSHSELVSYVPEKSAVVACLDSTRRIVAYAKLFAREGEADAASALHRHVTGAAPSVGLRVPAALGRSSDGKVLFTAAAVGQRLGDLTHGDSAAALVRLGAAVARFHGLPLTSGLPVTSRPTLRHLTGAASKLALVRPGIKALTSELLELLERLTPAAADVVLLHGDVHLKNALFSPSGVSLIDFDQVCTGPAAADVGSFLALLRSHTLSELLPVETATRLSYAFLEGYASVRPLPPAESLTWHTAAALLAERALRSVQRLRRSQIAHLEEILEDALDLLTEEAA